MTAPGTFARTSDRLPRRLKMSRAVFVSRQLVYPSNWSIASVPSCSVSLSPSATPNGPHRQGCRGDETRTASGRKREVYDHWTMVTQVSDSLSVPYLAILHEGERLSVQEYVVVLESVAKAR